MKIRKNLSNRLIWCIIIVLFCLSILSGCNKANNQPIIKTGFYFDTSVSITVYSKKDEKYLDDCFSLCKEFEDKFSSNIESSEISKINQNSNEQKMTTVSEDTISLLKKGIEFGKISNGSFDITIGKLSKLWNFSSDNPVVPDNSTIQDLIKDIDYKNIFIDQNQVLLKNNHCEIDLGGIAKGYIADQLKNFLRSKNVEHAIINLGGNVLLVGDKLDHSNYNIGIQKPFGGENDTIAVLSCSDLSIVSSGVYERYFYDENNQFFHHILDVKTGYPVINNLLGVTIISDLSVDGDGFSTTCFLLGLDKGMELINSTDGIEAVFVDSDYNLHLSNGLQKNDSIISIK